MKRIKVVVSVEYVDMADIPGIIRMSQQSVKAPLCQWTPVAIKVPASLTVTDKDDDKQRIFTATLRFSSCYEIPDVAAHRAWRVSTTDGYTYLIGSGGRPYPILNASVNMPDNEKDSQLVEYTVTYSDIYTIPYII